MKKKEDSNCPEKEVDTTNAYSVMMYNWDLIQRMRFMNADAEIDPEDSYSRGEKKFND